MLKVTLLGTGGTQPLPDRALAAAAVTVAGRSVLLDCGEGTQAAARRAGVNLMRADAICLTHYHGDHIFGLHNMPSQPLGKIGLRDGAMMASSDTLHIEVNGVGGHGAVPEHTVDATLVACHITIALQSIVSRNITPFQPAVVTVGSIQAGHAPNIINDKVLMKLTVRTLDERVRQTVLQRIHDIAVAQAESFNATATIRHINGSPVLKNNPQANEMVRSVATDLFGQDAVAEVNAFMGSEDFAFMLEKNPNGCYFTLGAGDEPDRCMVHNPGYDFNDNILLTGAALWAALTEHYLR